MYRPPLQQQSAEIRQRMQHVRSRMPWSMDHARADARRLTNWKFYVRRYPWVAAGAVAAIGYWLVPKRSFKGRLVAASSYSSSPVRRSGSPHQPDLGRRLLRALRGQSASDGDVDTTEVVAKSSLVGVVTSFLISSAFRMATTYAGNRFRDYFSSRVSASPVRRGPQRKPSQPEQIYDR